MEDFDTTLDKCLTSLVEIARATVGDSLSKVKAVGGSYLPSVYRDRQNLPQVADYPYITIDILDSDHTDVPLLYTNVGSNEDTYYCLHYRILFRYMVYGGKAFSIANRLHSWFSVEHVLNKLVCDTNGGLEEVMGVKSMPKKQATDFLECARFDLILNVPVTITTSQDGVFDSLVLNGKATQIGSTEETTFTISAPQNGD